MSLASLANLAKLVQQVCLANPGRPGQQVCLANPASLGQQVSPAHPGNLARLANPVPLAHRVNLVNVGHRPDALWAALEPDSQAFVADQCVWPGGQLWTICCA